MEIYLHSFLKLPYEKEMTIHNIRMDTVGETMHNIGQVQIEI